MSDVTAASALQDWLARRVACPPAPGPALSWEEGRGGGRRGAYHDQSVSEPCRGAWSGAGGRAGGAGTQPVRLEACPDH